MIKQEQLQSRIDCIDYKVERSGKIGWVVLLAYFDHNNQIYDYEVRFYNYDHKHWNPEIKSCMIDEVLNRFKQRLKNNEQAKQDT